MHIFVLKGATAQQLGFLARSLFQVRKDVLIGDISLRVAEKLWEFILEENNIIEAYWIRKFNNEQGFKVESKHDGTIDADGVDLFIKKRF